MSTMKVGDYLFARLKELGIETVFGVPGDYELALLDLIDDAGLTFRGNPNELIASYAADGYARVNGRGALVTTFGPGELSCYCGHAGAYTEFVPLVHIVGYPSREAIEKRSILHHSLGTGDMLMYHEMAKHISADTTILMDPATAPADIDRCLESMVRESRPVYVGVPVDISYEPCSSEGLKRKLATELPANDPVVEREVIAKLRHWLDTKENPIILVDGNTHRGVVAEAQQLSALTGLPTFTTAMGKGAVDERAANFGGVYNGGGSHDGVREAVKKADAVFTIGYFPSDFNTGEFTSTITEDITAEFQRHFVKIGNQKYDLKMQHVLRALVRDLERTPLAKPSISKVDWNPYPLNDPEKSERLTQDYLWPTFGKWLRDGDFVITETGTSAFGACDAWLPSGANTFNQTVFGSIGFATGASVGAFQAIKETGTYKRCILVTGEGSLQLTVQAFADLLNLGLNPIIFILNNDGYTIERLIHGPDAAYNTLTRWDYSLLAKTFGPEHTSSKYFGPIATADQLDELLASDSLNAEGSLRVVELILGKMDAPANVRNVAAAVGKSNSKPKAIHGAWRMDRV